MFLWTAPSGLKSTSYNFEGATRALRTLVSLQKG
jgi:hypothetical protein